MSTLCKSGVMRSTVEGSHLNSCSSSFSYSYSSIDSFLESGCPWTCCSEFLSFFFITIALIGCNKLSSDFYPSLFTQLVDVELVLRVHPPLSIVPYGLLNYLSHIKLYILKNSIIEDGSLFSHITHIATRENLKGDEVLPHFRYIR